VHGAPVRRASRRGIGHVRLHGWTEEESDLPGGIGRRTGHAEAVQIVFDPEKISYKELLDVYWRNIDPTTADRQFCDVGNQYRSAIFYHTEEQRREAMQSKEALEKGKTFKEPVVTGIVPAGDFYPAEEYHQPLLQEKSYPLQVLQVRVRPRPSAQGAVGAAAGG